MFCANWNCADFSSLLYQDHNIFFCILYRDHFLWWCVIFMWSLIQKCQITTTYVPMKVMRERSSRHGLDPGTFPRDLRWRPDISEMKISEQNNEQFICPPVLCGNKKTTAKKQHFICKVTVVSCYIITVQEIYAHPLVMFAEGWPEKWKLYR